MKLKKDIKQERQKEGVTGKPDTEPEAPMQPPGAPYQQGYELPVVMEEKNNTAASTGNGSSNKGMNNPQSMTKASSGLGLSDHHSSSNPHNQYPGESVGHPIGGYPPQYHPNQVHHPGNYPGMAQPPHHYPGYHNPQQGPYPPSQGTGAPYQTPERFHQTQQFNQYPPYPNPNYYKPGVPGYNQNPNINNNQGYNPNAGYRGPQNPGYPPNPYPAGAPPPAGNGQFYPAQQLPQGYTRPLINGGISAYYNQDQFTDVATIDQSVAQSIAKNGRNLPKKPIFEEELKKDSDEISRVRSHKQRRGKKRLADDKTVKSGNAAFSGLTEKEKLAEQEKRIKNLVSKVVDSD